MACGTICRLNQASHFGKRSVRFGGGGNNTAGAHYSTISGGVYNTIQANASFSTIAGGYSNITSGAGAFIGGGGFDGVNDGGNTANGAVSVIGGGIGNKATNYAATVAAGQDNLAGGRWAIVAGGNNNSANFEHATIGGGDGTQATYYFDTVAGGFGNIASGEGAFIGGGTFKSSSPLVSMMIRDSKGMNALSFAAVCQRCWLVPCLVAMSASMAFCQVRVAMTLSEPIKYALAICRLRMGCRNDSFLALSRILASDSSLVRRLSCLPVVLSS
jgi:hypothetical protein